MIVALVMIKKEFTTAAFKLPTDDLYALKKLAKKRNTSVTNVLRRAIGIEFYLTDLEDRGAKILMDENGKIQQIIRS